MEKDKILILVCGLPGTGKSVVSGVLAEKTGCALLNTDMVRKEKHEKPEYSERGKELVYMIMFSIAEKLLNSGRSVILDGTFYRKSYRDHTKEIAEKFKAKFHLVEVVCPEEVLRKRIEERQKGETVSDADYQVYLKVKKQFEPIKEKHFAIDTSKEIDEQVKEFLKTI